MNTWVRGVIILSRWNICFSWGLPSVRRRKNFVVKDIKGSFATPGRRPVSLEMLWDIETLPHGI
jgi:hypothetical protein